MSKLLIVDDEEDIREFAKHFFQKRGIESDTASGGKDALSILAKGNPDLILLDVRMGDITGVDVLRAMRASGNKTKVVMVTGVEDPIVINELEKLGIVGYVHKPLALEELERVVLKELRGQ